jgi:hypothetical protein
VRSDIINGGPRAAQGQLASKGKGSRTRQNGETLHFHMGSLGLTRASLFVSCHNLENLQDFLSCSIYHPKISKKLFGYQGFSELLNLSSKNLIWLSGMSRNAIKSLRF